MKLARIVIVLFLAAGIGFAIFGLMVRRAVTLEEVTPSEAMQRFEDARAGFGSAVPLVSVDEAGRPVRSDVDTDGASGAGRMEGAGGSDSAAGATSGAGSAGRAAPKRLHILVYRAEDERLAQAEVPFWFFKLKGPVVRLALRETDFDLGRLGLTPGELERLGPRLVLDETRANGDRVLVWTR